MRYASPNERRVISREALGLYCSVVLGGLYEFDGVDFDIKAPETFFGPLKHCIDTHPFLSVVFKDGLTDRAYFERVPSVNLENHVSIIQGDYTTKAHDTDETARFEQFLRPILDQPWPTSTSIPPWKIMVLPLDSPQDARRSRCLIAFVFSHGLGDGKNGLAFHRTFLEAIRLPPDTGNSVFHETPDKDIGEPFDTPQRLPISWGYLLLPLLAEVLPRWVSGFFGLRSSNTTIDSGTWTGSPTFHVPGSRHSRVMLLEIDSTKVEKALILSRKNGAKLTAVIHRLILRSLTKAIPDTGVTNFVSLTAVNMRRAVGISDDEMGLYVNVHDESHFRADEPASLSDDWWAAARSMTECFAQRAVTLQDQPIGLLRYAPSVVKWVAGKIGKGRDSSYELTNLVAFSDDQGDSKASHQCRITKMVFTHSANPTGSPLVFSVIGVKKGSLIIAVSWQQGALGVPEESENSFVEGICASLKEGFAELTSKA